LLGLVDDAQWLDQTSAQVLAFVARRLDAESVALLFGTRDPAGEGWLVGLPDLVLDGLSDSDARALLASALPGRLDERVRDRIIAESGGNPLALLELPRAATAAELAGGFGSAGSNPVASRIGQSFRRRFAALPALRATDTKSQFPSTQRSTTATNVEIRDDPVIPRFALSFPT